MDWMQKEKLYLNIYYTRTDLTAAGHVISKYFLKFAEKRSI